MARIISGGLLAGLALAGCGGSRSELLGAWAGEREGLIRPEAKNDPIAQGLKRVELTIKPDDSFELSDIGIPMAGTVRYDGSTARLKPKTRLGRPVNEDPRIAANISEFTLELNKDGSAIFRTHENPEGVTLRRKSPSVQ